MSTFFVSPLKKGLLLKERIGFLGVSVLKEFVILKGENLFLGEQLLKEKNAPSLRRKKIAP